MAEQNSDRTVRLIAGQVIVLETGDPIPSSDVRAFDVSTVRRANEKRSAALRLADMKWISTGTSLGSSLTDDNGEFLIEFGDAASITPLEIVIVVGAPRESKTATSDRIVYVSPDVRRSIGLAEEYLVAIPAKDIAPSSADPGSALKKTATVSSAVFHANTDALEDVVRTRVANRRDLQKKTRTQVEEALREKALSRFRRPDGSIAKNYVAPTTDVKQVLKETFKLTFDRIGTARMQALVDLDADARKALLGPSGAPIAGLTSAKIRDVLLSAARHPGVSNWAFYDALALDCRRRTILKRLAKKESIPSGTDGNGGNGGQPGIATTEDIKRRLTKLLDEIDKAGAPGDGEKPGSLAGINGFVHGLDLRGGAADQSAIFDFETLNFAFDHVWQDIFDPWWTTVVSSSVIEVGKYSSVAAATERRTSTFKTDLLEQLRYETDNIRAAAAAEFTRSPGAPGVSYSLVGSALGGLKQIGGAIAGAAEDAVDLVTPGGGGNRGGRRDHRTPGGGRRCNPRQQRDRGKRLKILNEYLEALDAIITADYPFTVFGADSSGRAINYGQVLTYRQHWEPKNYQAGELVKTLPLAPKQVVRFTTRRTTKKTFSEKRAQASENMYNSEDQTTARDIGKIVHNAQLATAFTLENKANASVPGVGGGESTATFQTNFSVQSSRTKETFREQVRKESQSFKNSSSVEIETTTAEELLEEHSGEVSNFNEEIAFTCLFYELQRRCTVSEKLHRLTPVVLVAEDVWKPSEITPELIARYDWIIRRVLLDSTFMGAVNTIAAGTLVAEQAGLADLEAMMDEQFDVVEDLRKQLERLARSADADEETRPSYRRPRTEPAEDVLDEDERRLNELEEELRRQEGLLAQAVDRFNEAFTSFATQAIQVKRLQMHIKENVIYYMQAVWEHEDRHQMLMRLRNAQVPVISGEVQYSLAETTLGAEPPTWNKPYRVSARPANFKVTDKTEDLAEVADLARPLGFFGNYRIFPLIKDNPITEFLTVPFLTGRGGVRDPDSAGNYTVGDLDAYAKCLEETMSASAFEDLRPKIVEVFERRLNDPRPDAEEIVLPTGSLFIELLPGTHSALEHFKRQHRAIDVASAVSDVIAKRLEHLRKAARIASDKLGDPDVDKVVVADADNVDLNDI